MSSQKTKLTQAAPERTHEGTMDPGQQPQLASALLRALSDLGEGVALVNPHTQRFVYVNDALCRLYGYSAAELLALPSFLALVVPEDQAAFGLRLAQRQQGQAVDNHYELAVCRKDGTRLTIEVAVTPIAGPHGPQLVAVIRDITARTQAAVALERQVEERTWALQRSEAAERAQREYLQVTLASIGDAVILTDPTGAVTFLNHVAEALTGWVTSDALGRPLAEVFRIVHEETRQPVESPITKVLRTGTTAGLANHTLLLTKEGDALPIDDSAAPIRDAQGRLLGIVLVFRDITERRQAEQMLQDSEARYRTLFDSIDEGFCVIEPVLDGTGKVVEFRYVAANPAFAGQSGGSDVVGKTIGQVFPGEPADWITTYAAVLSTGEPRRFERPLVTQGRILDLYAFRIADGSHTRVAVLFTDITQRRHAEAALQDHHALLNAIIEGTSDAVFMKDRQGRYVLINTAGAQWLGKPVGEVLGCTDADVFAPASVPDILAHDQHVLTTGEAQTYEHTGTAGENTRTYHSVKVPYRDRHGNIAGVIGIARDISDRARMETALRLSELRYRTVSELVSDYAYAVRIESDGRAELEWLTDAFSRITGFSREEVAEKEGLAWLIHPEDMPNVQQRLQALFAGQPGSSEHRIRTKSGAVRWLRDSSRAEWDPTHSRIVRIIGAGQDITAHKQGTEASLRLAAIVESSEDVIVSKTLDGIVTSWNAAAERIFGYRADEMVGQPILRIIPEDRQEEEPRILARLRRGERVDHFETVRRTKDGRLLDVSVTISPLRNEQGTIIGASKILRDITAHKQAEAERERLLTDLRRINEELQQFARIVSHDLSEPLRTMTNFVQLLAHRLNGQLDAEATAFITFVTDAAQRMQRMLTDLLAYTRAGQPPQFQVIDCEAVLAQVLGALQARITECGAVITHDPLPTLRGDATRLGQVLQNLIGNALKFCTPPPHIHISARPEGRHWRFAVRDNGIGIDPSQVGKLFQVFQRLHKQSEYPGTGIGLAICKKIIEQHGGQIWVESQPGQGATFYFTIGETGTLRTASET
jgi:PAS domain S-box-containing protein